MVKSFNSKVGRNKINAPKRESRSIPTTEEARKLFGMQRAFSFKVKVVLDRTKNKRVLGLARKLQRGFDEEFQRLVSNQPVDGRKMSNLHTQAQILANRLSQKSMLSSKWHR